MTFVGTRPEIIKLSRVIAKLDIFTNHILVHTGQNYDYELNEIFFEDLEIRKPDYFLNAAASTATETIGKILIDKPYPFALIKLFDPEFSVFKDETLKINNDNAEILSWKKSTKTLIGPVKILGKSVQRIHFGVYSDVL